MKTRVTEWWNTRWGVNTYSVEKWAPWDDPELRRYYPDAVDWRHVTSLLDKEKAVAMAERLSKDPDTDTQVIVWQSEE